MRYRAEIDGLRAVAVVPIILFHANLSAFSGGFAGVDVFFVISGYLITTIILDDIEAGRFSLLAFYERRLRRIAPALIFVCLACLPFASLWMLPEEFKAFGKSLFHTLLMVSNFELWGEVDYFAARSELKPLLHTWSLAVEEQFYLFFPPLLWLIRKWSRQRMFAIVAGVAVVSFALTLPVSAGDPVANFYLPFTRIWELALGALLAIYRPQNIRLPETAKSLLALVGLFVICCSYLVLRSTYPYPGPFTLIPCLGTLLVIAFAAPQNLTGQVLGLRWLVGIGLISYSLYLWHQPVFAFARLRMIEPLPPAFYLSLVALSFALALFSYIFIETPFRRGRAFSARQIFRFCGAGATALIVIGIVITEADGFPGRDEELARMRTVSTGLGEKCEGRVNPDCVTNPAPTMAVWGDSYAMHIVDGIVASQKPQSGGLVQLHMHNCGPLMTVAPVIPEKAATWPLDCLRHNVEVRDYLASTPSLAYVAVASPFKHYLDGHKMMTADGMVAKASYEVILQDLERTLDRLRSAGLKPVIFAPPPRDGRDSAICLSRARMIGIDDAFCAMRRIEQQHFDADVERLMREVSRRFPVVSLENYLCGETVCRVVDERVPFHSDDGHFSIQGSKHLGRKLDFYGQLIEAAEHGCSPDAGVTKPPHGICQLMPATAGSAQITPAKAPG